MKILVASHTYIVDLNCEKLRQLSQLQADIEVAVIVPKLWRPGGVQNKIIESVGKIEKNFQIIPISNFSKNNQGLLTFKTEVINFLKQFKPDIIQVEQGAKSLGYAQLITLNRLLNIKAKNVFFTWWNLPYKNKFPVSLLEKYNLRNTHGLISGNQDGVDILKEHGYSNKAIVLPQLGVDETLFAPRQRSPLESTINNNLRLNPARFTIGFVGRFVAEKGILTLIKALAKLKDLPWQLLLLGRGNLKEEIEKTAQEIEIQNQLTIVESVPHNQVPYYLNLMDTLVLPSETTSQFKTLTAAGWKEQFGHVLIEAMASQVAVIGSNSGEIPNVISDAGLVFPEKDVDALSNCLRKLIEQPLFKQELARKGYQRAIQKYTNKALAQEQFKFYKELLKSV
jgi:L-malate glycosyltransferase